MPKRPYTKFKDELNEEMRNLIPMAAPRNVAEHFELLQDASLRVFERWLTEERFDDLVKAVPENYDTTAPEALVRKISDALVSSADHQRLSQFWEALAKTRLESLCWHRRHPNGIEIAGKSIGASPKQVEELRRRAHWVVSEYLEALTKLKVDERLCQKVRRWAEETAG